MSRQRSANTPPTARYASWAEYVRTFMEPGERQSDVARRANLDQTTVSRWLSDSGRHTITSQSVAKFARAYGRPVLEAFVVAGFLTEDEAGISFSDLVDLSTVSDRDLLREVRNRLVHSDDVTHIPTVAVSTRRVSKR